MEGLSKKLLAGILVTMCTAWFTPAGHAQLTITEFMASNDETLVDDFGESSDWIEISNPTAGAIPLAGWKLSNTLGDTNAWTFPAVSIPANTELVVYASGRDITTNGVNALHTDFKLNTGGEYLALVAPNAAIATEFTPTYPAQETDVSYGFINASDLRYFLVPTPGAVNGAGILGFVADTSFSMDRGFYTNAFTTEITAATPGATLVYTTDSSTPSLGNGTQVTGTGTNHPVAMVSVTNTVVIRARAFKTDHEPSNTDTHTYVFLNQVIQQPASPSGFPATWDGVTADYEMDPDITSHPTYGPQMLDALNSLPSLSISTDQAHLFDATTGIYANPESKGVAWERPCSAELFHPDNRKEFQVNCGLRIQGGYFRGRNNTQKHSLRLLFKNEYGPGRLNHDLFPDHDSDVESFDTIVLRAGANDGYSWNGAGTTVQWTRDNFGRDLMRALGHPSPHGRFVHLYLNGLYWGLYNLVERPNENFSADYFGGEDLDWDANNAGEYKTGDGTAWNAFTAQANTATNITDYYAMQGLFPDGTRNPARPVYLDKPNYMDYMICNIWGGNWDWPNKNFWFGRLRTAESTGFKFYMWDFENTMGNSRGRSPLNMVSPRSNVANAWVGQPHNQLKDLPEYQIDFADRLHRAFFNDGALTPEKLVPRYSNLVAIIAQAAIAESARWGDDHVNPPRNQQEWKNERDWLLGTYLPQRSDIVMGQFLSNSLYPALAAPVYTQHGGIVPRGFSLGMTSDEGIIYYTLDGSDPREIGGGLNPNASLYTDPLTLTQPILVKARTRNGADWSALNEAQFVMSENPVRITEVMYRPRAATSNEALLGYTRSDFEYIELHNTSTQSVDITTLQLAGGVDFDFSTGAVTHLAADARVLVVRHAAALLSRYPAIPFGTIVGAYTGELNDDGEDLTLSETLKGEVQAFKYNDNRSWPLSADGAGHSLVPITDEGLDYGPHWRASAYRDGSPGAPDPLLVQQVFINEVASSATNATPDWVELYAASPQTLNDWYFSNDPDQLDQWPIAPGTVVNGWLPLLQAPGIDFDPAGDRLYVSHLPGTVQDRVVDAIAFPAIAATRSWGRLPDGSRNLQSMSRTPGSQNGSAPASVVFHEIMYHPAPNAEHPADNFQDEYVILQNVAAQSTTLQSAAGSWRVTGEVDYTFPPNTSMAPGAYLGLVPFAPSDPAALSSFANRYGIATNALTLFGPFTGKLSNRSGHLGLEAPQGTSGTIVDEVYYLDEAPFPIEADGHGAAIHRVGQTNWVVGAPTPASDVIGLAPLLLTGQASNITWTSAHLHATLSSTGSAPTAIFAYYGTSDGGTSSNAWDQYVQLGYQPTGLLTVPVHALPEDSTVFFRLRAQNAAGSSWMGASQSFQTERNPVAGFERRMKITFSGYTKSEVLTDFPALIQFEAPGFDYRQWYSPEGADLRFLDETQSRLLPHEIEHWNTNGLSSTWVNVPAITSSNSCIWAYWGNSNAAVSIPVPDISGLELWLDAGNLNQANSSPVTAWTDASDAGRDASEGSDPPLYVEEVINGQPVVRFDGVNDHLGFSNGGLSARTIFFVARVNFGGKNLAGLIGRDGGDKGIRRIGANDWRHPGDGNDFSNPAGSTFFVNGQSGGTIGENIWHIGAATRSNTSNTDYNSLGGYFNGREYGGDLAEIIVYNRVLTLEEQDLVGSYLAQKYDIQTAYTGGGSTPTANGSVWNSDYRAVYHLNETPEDATENAFDGVIQNDTAPQPVGQIGGMHQFDGIDDAIAIDAQVGAVASLTASLWVRIDSLQQQRLLDKNVGGNAGSGFALACDASGNLLWQVGSAGNATILQTPVPLLAAQTWTHVAGTYHNGTAQLYVHGVLRASTNTSQQVIDTTAPLWLGASQLAPADDFSGRLDEVRLSATERSACWLWASYQNQRGGSDFTSFSPIIATVSDSDGDQLEDAWELTHFGNLDQDGSLDSDGDGHLDRDEHRSGTSPTSSDSVLFVGEQVDATTGALSALQWPSQPGKRYGLSRAGSLSGPWEMLANNIAATPPVNTWTLPPTLSIRYYYRVQIIE